MKSCYKKLEGFIKEGQNMGGSGDAMGSGDCLFYVDCLVFAFILPHYATIN